MFDRKEYMKEWEQNNKQERKEYRKLYRENHKEECKEYNKLYHKEYRKDQKQKRIDNQEFKSYIYKYYHNENLLYIGSTFDYINRHITHKKDLKRDKQPFHKYLNENNINLDDLRLELIGTNIVSKPILEIYENSLIKRLQPLCNYKGK